MFYHATVYSFSLFELNKVGALTSLQRYGLSAKPSSFGLIGNLAMNYTGNQLSGVTEHTASEPLYTGAFNFVKRAAAVRSTPTMSMKI